jgi:hypothetical protein
VPEDLLIGVAARCIYDGLIHGFLLLGYSSNPAFLAIEPRCQIYCCSQITTKAGLGSCTRQYQQATSRVIPLSPRSPSYYVDSYLCSLRLMPENLARSPSKWCSYASASCPRSNTVLCCLVFFSYRTCRKMRYVESLGMPWT